MTHHKDACPDCGQPKGVQSDRCRRCAGLVRRTAKHGTDSRYFRHRRDGEEACEACLAAHRAVNGEAERQRRAARRRARAQQRAARLVCPVCGGRKSRKSRTCARCISKGGRRNAAQHGTDSGYYRHLRKPDPENGWPRTACDECQAAHRVAARRRTGGKPCRVVRTFKTCQVCAASLGRRNETGLCRSCVQRARNEPSLPIHWRRVGMIWKAA